MAIFRSNDYHWQPNFSNHIKFKLETSKFEVDMLRHFYVVAVVVRPILYFLFSNSDLHLDDYQIQIQTKIL